MAIIGWDSIDRFSAPTSLHKYFRKICNEFMNTHFGAKFTQERKKMASLMRERLSEFSDYTKPVGSISDPLAAYVQDIVDSWKSDIIMACTTDMIKYKSVF